MFGVGRRLERQVGEQKKSGDPSPSTVNGLEPHEGELHMASVKYTRLIMGICLIYLIIYC